MNEPPILSEESLAGIELRRETMNGPFYRSPTCSFVHYEVLRERLLPLARNLYQITGQVVTVYFDEKEEFYHLTLTVEGHFYDVRFYKVFGVLRDGIDDRHNHYFAQADQVERFFRLKEYHSWNK